MKEKIIEIANEIYRKYGNEDLDFVAGKLGAKVFEELKTDILKEVYFPDLKAIAIKPNLNPYERRYLIAHALGHHLFHRKGLYKNYIQLYKEGYPGKLKIGIKEREAEIFASYLLIPEDKLNTILREDWINNSLDPIAEIAEEFNVPEEIIKRRIEFEKQNKKI